jgi:hypothetical protein
MRKIMVGNPECKSQKHPIHICALKDAGLSGKSFAEVAELVDSPKFRCEICGATANRAENLCNPKKI